MAILNDSRIIIKYIIIKKIDPKKPNSSPNIVNIKSLCISGKKLRWLWVPSRNPFPKKPPEPRAILDWRIWYPLPSGSLSGLKKVKTLSFWYSFKNCHTIGIDNKPIKPPSDDLRDFIMNKLGISDEAVCLGVKRANIENSPLPIVMWSYGFLSLAQLNIILAWQKVN